MELNEKWGTSAFPSLRNALEAMGYGYGQRSLHLNAAMAMFLLASDEEREIWIQLVERARRGENNTPILERIKQLRGGTTPQSAATGSPKIDPKLKASSDKGLRDSLPKKKAAS